MLSVKEKLKNESAVDLISARHFTHSALGTRPVVRLVADNLAAAELQLTQDELARLDAVSRPHLIYPYWHQAWTDPERLSPADLSLLGKYQKPRAP